MVALHENRKRPLMRRAHVTAAVGGVLVALLAAGCGGGGSGTPPRPPAAPPAAPSGAAAATLSAEGIQLTWTDNSADETGFEIQWSMSAEGPFTHRGTVSANVTAYDDFGLGASGTYFYRVRATTAADASAWSGTASATTQDNPWNPPAEPAGVAAGGPLHLRDPDHLDRPVHGRDGVRDRARAERRRAFRAGRDREGERDAVRGRGPLPRDDVLLQGPRDERGRRVLLVERR